MKKFLLSVLILCDLMTNAQSISGQLVGRYSTGIFDQGAAEIICYDKESKLIVSVNASAGALDFIDFSVPSQPELIKSIDLSPYGSAANSVASFNGLIAAAIEDNTKQNPGKVILLNSQGEVLKVINVGALPDMLCFSNDGNLLLVANEGEPNTDYTIDPVGSVSIIDLSRGLDLIETTHVGFEQFDGQEDSLRLAGIRIFGPNASFSQDMEPEYIALSPDQKFAYVSCQENNAMVKIDLQSKSVVSITSLGTKNHLSAGNGLDASDKNGLQISIKQWPLRGMYMPDGIATYSYGSGTYLVTANEGDAREYGNFVENDRAKNLNIDPSLLAAYPGLLDDNSIGRLNASKFDGDIDGDGDIDLIHSYGARSFSIWNENMELVFDSGDEIERYFEQNLANSFNVSHTNNTKKNRSDDKGPEPEAILIKTIGDSTYAFIGLERMSGVMIYNISIPTNAYLIGYLSSRDFSEMPGTNTAGGDLGPEGLLFIGQTESPNGKPYLLAANEISGSIAVYELQGGIFTNIDETKSTKVALIAYPNPALSNKLYLNHKFTGNIMNSTGTILASFENVQEINIEGLPSGLYFLISQTETVKIVIERN